MQFIRQARLPVPSVAHGDIDVQRPPEVPKPTPANAVARLMPLAMLVAAVGMMAVYFTSGSGVAGASGSMRNPMYMFFPVMMLSSVIGSLAYGMRGNGSAEINHDRRNYLRYLDALDSTIERATDDQRRSLRWSHPDPNELWTLIGGQRMWERRPGDPDFCLVRVGCADQELDVRLVAPELGPVDELDPVTVSAMHDVIRQRSVVVDLPATVSLRCWSAVTVEGDADAARALVRAMICQLAVFHCPDDVAVAAAVDATASDRWDWLKWLPHHRYSGARHRVLICDGDAPTTPRDDVTIIEIGARSGAESGQLRLDPDAMTDALTLAQAETCARRLARYRLVETDGQPARGWLGLMGIDDVAGLDPAGLWSPRCGVRIKPVPIGVTEDGVPVHLDINEAARDGVGPHGLCVGATGSGKSEFLRTLALGMMTVHSPDDLNMVLVDFKGGATFLGMERARHVAAVITNLVDEAHLVSRMREALSGEMNRRQELLRSAGNFANVFDYQDARTRGAALAPLPTLFIIVDEFSELLSQHPEFAELFVAIGRLGRSLGMHLLLASQRVDEGRLRGLDTQLSYRICLKTFSAAESRSVLGVPDAYHLPSTPGAAYLTTAPGALVRFQTAFVSGSGGAAARPPTTPALPTVFTAAPVDETSREPSAERTLLDAMLDRLRGRGTPARQVWLPPLTDSPMLDDLTHGWTRSGLTVPIGLVDNPFDQRRELLLVDLAGAEGNVAVVGAPQSGKSTAVCTLLTALTQQHAPGEVSFYCLDFGGGALSSLRGMAHVGAVAGRLDVDLCRRIVAVVESVVTAREARRVANDTAAEADRFGEVFLVVDGWATLRQEFEGLEAAITAIGSRGLSHGVHVVVTASRWAELRPALKDQLGTRIELRLGDPADSEVDRKSARLLTGRPPGRGITASGREMVLAVPRLDDSTASGPCVPPVELLPNHISHHDLVAKAAQSTHTLMGLGERELTPVALDFTEHSHLLVLGETGCGKTAALRLLCREIIRTATVDEAQIEIVDFRRTLLGVVESDHLAGYAMSPASLASRLRVLLDTLDARMPGEDVTQQQLRTRSWWSGPEIYVVVDDYDLAAGTTGNPLTPLADLLPHSKDLGLHVVVARRSGGAARAMFDPVLTRMRDLGSMGLMMSASPDEGVLLGSVRPSPLPPGRGTLITRGEPDQIVHIAWTDPP
jgi:S-DNA-T family DNA segregation ATPase FtsK/SpoIIIE